MYVVFLISFFGKKIHRLSPRIEFCKLKIWTAFNFDQMNVLLAGGSTEITGKPGWKPLVHEWFSPLLELTSRYHVNLAQRERESGRQADLNISSEKGFSIESS